MFNCLSIAGSEKSHARSAIMCGICPPEPEQVKTTRLFTLQSDPYWRLLDIPVRVSALLIASTYRETLALSLSLSARHNK